VVEAAGAERPDDLVEAGADARHLGLGDPRFDAQRGDQVVDGAGGHAVDVGLDHHRVQGLVDAAARFQDRRKERALAELGDAQLDVAGLGRHQPGPGAVAVRDPGVGAFIAGGADLLARFGLDQLLHHQANGIAHEVDALAGTERVQQLGQDRLGQGHRCRLLTCALGRTHRESRRWPHPWWTPAGYLKPHHLAGRTLREPGRRDPECRAAWRFPGSPVTWGVVVGIMPQIRRGGCGGRDGVEHAEGGVASLGVVGDLMATAAG
jgi:hypothetical protein